VTTDNGDINVWGDCNSDLSQFFTRNGHVHIRQLYNNSYILIRESGNVNVNMVEGSLTCVVKRGAIFANVENITTDSTIQVAEGEITVTLPARPAFRVTISATNTNIAPKLLNSGDFFLYENGQRETFNTGPYMPPKDRVQKPGEGANVGTSSQAVPVLNVVANQGNVTVVINEATAKRDFSNGDMS